MSTGKRVFCLLCGPQLYFYLADLGLQARKSPQWQHLVFQCKEQLEEILSTPTSLQFRGYKAEQVASPSLSWGIEVNGRRAEHRHQHSHRAGGTAGYPGWIWPVPSQCLDFKVGPRSMYFLGLIQVPAVRNGTICFYFVSTTELYPAFKTIS